jgi:hypothetical protein
MDGVQDSYPMWENIILLKASSEEQAFAKAETRGRADVQHPDPTFTWGKRPAMWVFGGVRKIMKCDERPGDGTELSYLQLEVSSKVQMRKLLKGRPVPVLYED